MTARPSIWAVTCLLLVANIALAEPAAQPSAGSRPANWARPLERPGVPNFYQVSETLYRGAQPTAGGLRELQKLGVKTVINLRSLHSDNDLLPEGMGYVSIPMKAWHIEDEDMAQIVRLLQDTDRLPAFIHCQHGSDRTGVACAVYRMAVEGWTREEAISEMVDGGYGFWPRWGNIKQYLRTVELDDLR